MPISWKADTCKKAEYREAAFINEAETRINQGSTQRNAWKIWQQIAEGLGVSHHTVAAQRDNLETGGQIAHVKKSKGKDGKEYPRTRKKPVSVFNPTKRDVYLDIRNYKTVGKNLNQIYECGYLLDL